MVTDVAGLEDPAAKPASNVLQDRYPAGPGAPGAQRELVNLVTTLAAPDQQLKCLAQAAKSATTSVTP
jgi:hypothetical protein